jgi:uncharacterized membrane protein YqiK
MFKNRFFSLLVAVALAVIAILTAQDAIATSNVASDQLETLGMQKNWMADAARWTAMGEYYQNRAEAGNLAHSLTADAVRWTAMAEYFQKRAQAEAQNLARGQAADSARWTAMADYYAQFSATAP